MVDFFKKLLAKLISPSEPEPAPPIPANLFALAPTSQTTVESILKPNQNPASYVSEKELADAVECYAFVLDKELPPLQPYERWFDENDSLIDLQAGAPTALTWLDPFVPRDLANTYLLESIRADLRTDIPVPCLAKSRIEELRALITARRKTKQPHDELFEITYGMGALADFIWNLKFDRVKADKLLPYVSNKDMQLVQLDFAITGCNAFRGLIQTDRNRLNKAFGEPSKHRSFLDVWPEVIQNAISRYCWDTLREENEQALLIGAPDWTMREWLEDLFMARIGFRKRQEAWDVYYGHGPLRLSKT